MTDGTKSGRSSLRKQSDQPSFAILMKELSQNKSLNQSKLMLKKAETSRSNKYIIRVMVNITEIL